MSYRYVDANRVVNIVDFDTQIKINEMDCVYIDGILPNNQQFNLADHDKQIRDEVIEEIFIKAKDLLLKECNPNCICNEDGYCPYRECTEDVLTILKQMKGEQDELD